MPRPLLGAVLLAATAAILALAWGTTFPPGGRTTLGMRLVAAGSDARIFSVTHGTPAERAGLRPGDTIALTRMPFATRLRLVLDLGAPGRVIPLAIERAGHRHVVSIAAARDDRPRTLQPVTYANLISGTLTVLIFGIIGWRRPTLTSAILVYCGSNVIFSGAVMVLIENAPDAVFGPLGVASFLVFSSCPVLALLAFITRFPSAPVSSAARLRMHAADGLFVAGFIIFGYEAWAEPLLLTSWSGFDAWEPWIVAIFPILFGLLVYRDASGEDRQRIGWVIAGLIVSDLGAALYNYLDSLSFFSGADASPGLRALMTLGQAMQLGLPLALAYAVLRHRVIDLGFVLNRTAVYALTTTLIVALVGFVDWLSGRLVSEARFALALEAIVTIGLGFGLNFLHARIETLVDRVIFRERHRAERRIEFRLGALMFAETIASVDEALALDAGDILDLSSAAVFRRSSSALPFERALATGWPEDSAREIDPDALLVRSLRSLERAFFLDDVGVTFARFPAGAARPVLAIPLVAQHELLGFVLYGTHRDGASLDPEEVALLGRLTQAAATSYGAVEARQWRERFAELERHVLQAPSS
jgi:hypothetical protein